MFDKKGQIIVDKEEFDGDSDELMMTALDAGAEDFSEERRQLLRSLQHRKISVLYVRLLKKLEFQWQVQRLQ